MYNNNQNKKIKPATQVVDMSINLENERIVNTKIQRSKRASGEKDI